MRIEYKELRAFRIGELFFMGVSLDVIRRSKGGDR